jgi:hypothetical protein
VGSSSSLVKQQIIKYVFAAFPLSNVALDIERKERLA